MLIKEECGGAPVLLQKGITSSPGDVPTPVPGTPAAGDETPTPAAGVCEADPNLGISVGDEVRLRVDAIVRDAPAGGDTGRRGANVLGTVTAGPECAEGLVWWEVETDAGSGWTAEQDQAGVRLILEP